MPLRIYQVADPSTAFSNSGNMTNPFRVSFDGRLGGVVQNRLYLRNDDTSVYYSGINVFPVDTGANHITDGTNNYSWKLNLGDQQPLEQQWATIANNNTITISGLGGAHLADTTSYIPFWVRVEVPKGAPVNSYDEVIIRITASGLAVS